MLPYSYIIPYLLPYSYYHVTLFLYQNSVEINGWVDKLLYNYSLINGYRVFLGEQLNQVLVLVSAQFRPPTYSYRVKVS